MEDKKRVVERRPVQAFLEISLDKKKAAIVFQAEDGTEYILKAHDMDDYRNLAVEEI